VQTFSNKLARGSYAIASRYEKLRLRSDSANCSDYDVCVTRLEKGQGALCKAGTGVDSLSVPPRPELTLLPSTSASPSIGWRTTSNRPRHERVSYGLHKPVSDVGVSKRVVCRMCTLTLAGGE
jgi:hypothetical protein